MLYEDELLELEERAQPRRGGARRGLTVRMLAAKTEWLEGELVWQEGRVGWRQGEAIILPEPADLARAERNLNRVRRFPRSADSTLGDAQAWLRRRFARLELAKTLTVLRCPDPAEVTRAARDRNLRAIEKLCEMLRAEAYCVSGLSHSPAEALLAAGRAALDAVATAATNPRELPGARALAALILGALAGRCGVRLQVPREASDDWSRRAWNWGRSQGLSDHPALVTALLRGTDSAGPAFRCLAALGSENPLGVEAVQIRSWLADGLEAVEAVALAEALGEARPLADRLLNFRPHLPDTPQKKRREAAHAWSETSLRTVAAVRKALTGIADETRSAAAISHGVRVLKRLLPDVTPTAGCAESALVPILARRDGSPELRVHWLRLLDELYDVIWEGCPEPTDDEPCSEGQMIAWLNTRWLYCVKPLHELLHRTGDAELAAEAGRLGFSYSLNRCDFYSADCYRVAAWIGKTIAATPNHYALNTACSILPRFATPADARRSLRLVLEALQPIPAEDRPDIFAALVFGPDCPRWRERISRLPAYARLLLALPDDLDWDAREEYAQALIELDNAVGEEGPGIATELLPQVTDLLRERPALKDRLWALDDGVRLAYALADGAEPLPFDIIRTVMEHDFTLWEGGRQEGIKLAPRLPWIRRILRSALPRQPLRCAELLGRLGHTAKLGPATHAALAEPEACSFPADVRDAWAQVLQITPDLAPGIAAYVRHRELSGQEADVPPGVRTALAQREKLARELSYLEARLAQEDHPHLRARAESLRGRLADEDGLTRRLAEEIRDHFASIADEAGLTAAERQVSECYRGCLERIAGPLPPQITLDEDWLNAALLSVTVETNKKLLRRMLRAEMTGARDWREKHPTNVEFLRELGERGGDAEAWLGSHRRLFRCEGVAGNRVRVHLEQRPLRILQMGNYFDTCLSANGCNAFSTVANACELNKRVIYATDGKGRIIARKLIGLNAGGKLIGYTLYNTVSDDAIRSRLAAIIRRYAADFATRCSLEQSDEGAVPRLFAQAWYDDGIRAWNADNECPTAGRSRPRKANTGPEGTGG